MRAEFLSENMRGGILDETTVLKRITSKWSLNVWAQYTGFCEVGNEPSGSMTGGQFLKDLQPRRHWQRRKLVSEVPLLGQQADTITQKTKHSIGQFTSEVYCRTWPATQCWRIFLKRQQKKMFQPSAHRQEFCVCWTQPSTTLPPLSNNAFWAPGLEDKSAQKLGITSLKLSFVQMQIQRANLVATPTNSSLTNPWAADHFGVVNTRRRITLNWALANTMWR